MAISQRLIKVDKTDVVGIDISFWLGSEDILNFTVSEESGNAQVISSSVEDTKLLVLLRGLSVGNSELHFDYNTLTRNDCFKLTVKITEGC